MHTALLVFEFLGTTELLVIALFALIIFGPRKLPEIGRSLGKGIADFKRASDDFKRTWEYEVEVDTRKPASDAVQLPPPANPPASADATAGAATGVAAGVATTDFVMQPAHSQGEPQPIARGSAATQEEHATDAAAAHRVVGTSAIRDDEGDVEMNAS
jgi:TatA/E family protein of Tat protein translocase